MVAFGYTFNEIDTVDTVTVATGAFSTQPAPKAPFPFFAMERTLKPDDVTRHLPLPSIIIGVLLAVKRLEELAIGEKLRAENTCVIPAEQANSIMIIRYVPLVIRMINFTTG